MDRRSFFGAVAASYAALVIPCSTPPTPTLVLEGVSGIHSGNAWTLTYDLVNPATGQRRQYVFISESLELCQIRQFARAVGRPQTLAQIREHLAVGPGLPGDAVAR